MNGIISNVFYNWLSYTEFQNYSLGISFAFSFKMYFFISYTAFLCFSYIRLICRAGCCGLCVYNRMPEYFNTLERTFCTHSRALKISNSVLNMVNNNCKSSVTFCSCSQLLQIRLDLIL